MNQPVLEQETCRGHYKHCDEQGSISSLTTVPVSNTKTKVSPETMTSKKVSHDESEEAVASFSITEVGTVPAADPNAFRDGVSSLTASNSSSGEELDDDLQQQVLEAKQKAKKEQRKRNYKRNLQQEHEDAKKKKPRRDNDDDAPPKPPPAATAATAG